MDVAKRWGDTRGGDRRITRSALSPVARQCDRSMFWTVSEGGAPFGTAMPSFKDRLPESDRWAVIAYIQAHLPQVKAGR